ncbi:MMPL family transporter [Conexibacter sp. DBS9H8]|uniref:MMPL family transporter n=1 Tax=Conexibacter sp. DBS9H8 TaxID=2937801 RepID=UPI00200EEAE2|nr:MMPL family transporter [Conexibacter sp. DBS9H8]
MTLLVWALVIGVLAVEGLSFGSRIAPSSLNVPGSASYRAEQVEARYFGLQAEIPVLLQGPRRAVDSQGRALVARLRSHPGYTVLSPWDQGAAIPELRPARDAAVVLVLVKTKNLLVGSSGEAVRSLAQRFTRSPVRVSVSGFSVIGGALKADALTATHNAEMVAIPVLLLVLLLVFRSPIAALIPAVFGVAAVQAGFGAVGLLATRLQISDVATALTSMMGLALGVDYSLLLVSRFREELAHGRDPRSAAAGAQAAAGGPVLFAGFALIVAMIVAIALSPGNFLLSAAASVAVVAAISMGGAYLAVPAVLALLGARIDRWRIGRPPREDGRWASLARAVQRRPLLTAAAALVPLVAVGTQAFALTTGPPDVRDLPPASQTRVQSERVAQVLGPGWSAPYEVYVADPNGPVTTPRRLRAIERWQERIARMSDVRTVIGPGEIAARDPTLLHAAGTAEQVRRSLSDSGGQARQLSAGLARASSGVGQLRSGLLQARSAASALGTGGAQASDAATRLSAALAQAHAGAETLRRALAQAAAGAGRLTGAISSAHGGSRQLTGALARAAAGSSRLATGAGQLASGLAAGQGQLAQLKTASDTATGDAATLLSALEGMTVGKLDPRYQQALRAAGELDAFTTGRDPRTGSPVEPGYLGLSPALATAETRLSQAAAGAAQLNAAAITLANGLGRLTAGASRLSAGIATLAGGASTLEQGLAQLSQRSSALPAGLAALQNGAARLAGGLARLKVGSGQLANGLASGAGQTQTLQAGLDNASRQTTQAATGGNQAQQLSQLQSRSPRLLSSGYFVLAALDGADQSARTQAGYTVNLKGGGQAARITIIPNSGPNDPATRALRARLRQQLPALASATGANTYLGGVAAQLADYQHTLGDALPILIIALSIAAAILLAIILRAIVLAAISVALNLVTVGASFGIVELLFQGHHPPLGGPGYADILSLLSTFTVVFGLSLDYQVFVLTRIREAWQQTHDLERSITLAIDRTGRVITGAAVIMSAVFIAFTFAELSLIRQAGVGLASAVLIDATLVRLILLPAAIRLAGPVTFYFPAWLDHHLPTIHHDTTTPPCPAPHAA